MLRNGVNCGFFVRQSALFFDHTFKGVVTPKGSP